MREAVGAAIPLAGVGCAIARRALAELAARQDGKPFAGGSMTEDYELGLRLGAIGKKTMFVRCRSARANAAWSQAAAIFRRRWARPCGRKRAGSAALRSPAGTGSAGAAALASAGCGCATGAGRLLPCYPRRLCRRVDVVANLACRSPGRADQGPARPDADHPADDQRLAACLADPDARELHGLRLRRGRGPASIPRFVVGNVIAMLAAARAVSIHVGGGATQLGQDPHIFPRSCRDEAVAALPGAGDPRLGRRRAPQRSARSPAPSCSGSTRSEAKAPPPIVPTQFPADRARWGRDLPTCASA